ncbi:MAG: acyl-CoA reductase, partial [Odoribacter sp.]|nr:acyl-CoA reductase [Odoribacter sp.]
MNLEERINAFSDLGEILRNSINGRTGYHQDYLNNLIINQEKHNQFFTPANVRMAVKAISGELTFENLKKWTNNYPVLNETINPVNVGVIMAGNIPLAGFHDFLSVLISGHNITAKTSSKDAELILYLSDILCSINTGFREKIKFTDGFLTDFNAVIATGSDNSSRYFEYYFARYPHIIRKNRNSVAIIDGNETDQELENLGTDIFSYFGLGCRSVSKIYLPEGYDFHTLIRNWDKYSALINHNKYANNYEYNMAIYLVNKEKFLDTGYLLLKESMELSSPVSVLYYEFYNSSEKLSGFINNNREKIQCVVGRDFIPFGEAQFPKLWDFADKIDTLDFLL